MKTNGTARRVEELVGLLGITEASRVLELHHSSVAAVMAGKPVKRNTATLLLQRLDELEDAKAPDAR